MCLVNEQSGLVTAATVVVFDRDFKVVRTIGLAGLSSPVRVSPDGRYAATTTFVTGDSYAQAGFSTRTTFLDLRAGVAMYELERFAVTKDGGLFLGADFNFWGVTFVEGHHHLLRDARHRWRHVPHQGRRPHAQSARRPQRRGMSGALP